MDINLMIDSVPTLLKGALLSLELVALSMVIGMVLAIPLALFRISKTSWIRVPAYCYIYFFRGTPLLVQMFLKKLDEPNEPPNGSCKDFVKTC